MPSVAVGQDFDDPFAAPDVAATVGQPAAVDAAAGPADAAAPAPAPPPIDLTQFGPAVQAVLEQDPTTPEGLLEGILLLIGLGQPELARPWLDALLRSPPDTETQAELARQVGSHRLMRLATEDTLGEDARKLANSLMEAFAAKVRDPARLQELIGQLADPATEVRYAAVVGLVEAGETAAAAVVAALDDVQSEAHRTWLQIALAELAPESIGPLLAGLEADSAAIRASSASVLGRVVPAHLAYWLLSPALADEDPQVRRAASEALGRIFRQAPTVQSAERILRDTLEQYLEGSRPLPTVEEGEVAVWRWDAATQAPASTRLEPDQARIYVASRVARDLMNLVPSNWRYREQDTMLQLAAGELGLPLGDQPGAGEMDLEGRRQLLIAALEEALRRDVARAIVGAARSLASLPDGESILLSRAPAESPLVRALNHPSETVQWEALAAIMQIDPQTPYPGASRVTRALAEFIQSGGRPRAVVALPTIEQARNVAAALDRLGYDVSLATSGRQAILAAAASGGSELVLVDAHIGRPSIREVLYQIRVNPTSSGAAIGVLGTGVSLDRAREAAADHPGVQAFPHPWELSGIVFDENMPPPPPGEEGLTPVPRVILDEDAVDTILERLARADQEIAPGGTATRDERAHQAFAWLGALLSRGETFYDVRKLEPVVLQGVDHPPLMEAAVTVLAHFGSHESQRRLVELASSRIVPIELRIQAAEAFRASARRYGVQLTSSEILRQYDRYNASETADRPTQQVLGHVLDTIEMKRLQTAGE